MKITTIVVLAAISNTSTAKVSGNDELESQLDFDSQVFAQLRSFPRLPNASTPRLPVSDIRLLIPDSYSDESKNRISELMGELKLHCPDCSTGGTIRGGVIIGGGATPSANPLFPVRNQLCSSDSEQVLINKNELANLRRKAAQFDLIKPGRDNDD